jgi:formate C-acetyltransferase
MLGGYLKHDLDSGTLTLEQAREILAHFFIKGCEWITSTNPDRYCGGDGQHYQNIVLAGIDENGEEVTNEVTYLVLDIIEELGISDFPVSVRLNAKSPDKLLHRCADVVRHGGGIIAFYNEDLIIPSLIQYGYPEQEARGFANDGCWEVLVPGKTWFQYTPFDALKLLNDTLGLDGDIVLYDDYNALYAAFKEKLKQTAERIYTEIIDMRNSAETGWSWRQQAPCSLISLLTEGCAENGRGYWDGGAKYNVHSLHIGGAPDTGNSLYAIYKLVYEDKKVTLKELLTAVRGNWEGHEALRRYAANRLTYYGNDGDADMFTKQVIDDFGDICMSLNNRCPIHFPAGVSTFGRQIEWRQHRTATVFGQKKGAILSGNTSPSPGTDITGATAVIKSYCKIDLAKQVCGAALDLVLHQSAIRGDNGVTAIKDLLRGFVSLNGSFIQIDAADTEVLKKAAEDPNAYKTLSVRVSGWNARFVTLDREWQKMIIEREGNYASGN